MVGCGHRRTSRREIFCTQLRDTKVCKREIGRIIQNENVNNMIIKDKSQTPVFVCLFVCLLLFFQVCLQTTVLGLTCVKVSVILIIPFSKKTEIYAEYRAKFMHHHHINGARNIKIIKFESFFYAGIGSYNK